MSIDKTDEIVKLNRVSIYELKLCVSSYVVFEC